MLPLILLSCRPDGTEDSDGVGDSVADHSGGEVDLPTAGCGAPEYSWLPTDTMGTLIDADVQDGLSISADTISLLLSGFVETESLPEAGYGVQTHYVRYLTQDRGHPVEATGLMVFPQVDTPQSFPTLLWLHPTMGFSDACAPTAVGLEGAALPMLFASMGFVVVAPDYLGMAGWGTPSEMSHPYVIAEPTAVASLDMLRAAVNVAAEEQTLAAPDPERVLYWGVSQGGHAALWVDRYAPHYAPEFTAIGNISVIPATDMLTLAALGMEAYSPATLAIAANLSSAALWYQTERSPSEVFVEGMDVAIPDLMEQTCNEFGDLGEIAEVSDLFTPKAIDALATGAADSLQPWSCFLDQSTLRTSAIPYQADTPTLVILAEEDDLAIAAPARSDIEVLCAQGHRIEHLECAGAGHVDAAVDTIATQLAWAQARAGGDAWDVEACVINEPIDCSGEDK